MMVAQWAPQQIRKYIIPRNQKTIFWKRYVDNVFAIIEGDINANEIKDTVNSYNSQKQFAMKEQ